MHWAHNPQNLGVLKARLCNLETKNSPVGREYLVLDLADMKKKYKIQDLTNELKRFASLKSDVDTLAEAVATIVGRTMVS